QEDEREGLDRTLHIETVPVNQFVYCRAGLLGPIGVQLDSVTTRLRVRGHDLERNTFPDAGINCCTRAARKAQDSPDALGFSDWKWIEAQPLTPSKTHGTLRVRNCAVSVFEWLL